MNDLKADQIFISDQAFIILLNSGGQLYHCTTNEIFN